jgi:hypothetical protein
MENGMDVCDMNGDKIGTVERVYRHELAAVGGGPEAATEGTQPNREEIVEVKTGFLGLGKHLYVPLSHIHDVTQGCVFIDKTRDEIDDLDWSTRPDYIEDLT